MPAVVLHLRIRVSPAKREELLAFLRDAREYYEQGGDGKGGVRMRLLQDAEDESGGAFIEVFEYDTIEAYRADEQRVAGDPMMKAVLTKWRSLLKGKPKVETYIDLTESESLGSHETTDEHE